MSENHYLCSECGHTKMWHWLDGKGCNSPKVDEKCSCHGFKNSGHYVGEEEDKKALATKDRLMLRLCAGDLKVIRCTYATRPSPSVVGEALAYSTDACALEISDGINWRDEHGILT